MTIDLTDTESEDWLDDLEYEEDEQEKGPVVVDLDAGAGKQMSTPPGVPPDAQYLSPDEEPPEGAETYEGPQGGTYYVPPGESGEDSTPETDSFGGVEGSEPVDESFEVADEDSTTFTSYMTHRHDEINAVLRGDAEPSERTQQEIETMQQYIDEAPEFDEPTTVHRGLTAPQELAEQLTEAEGEQVALEGFQSTTHNPEVAEGFTNFADEDEVPVLMSIETDTGLPLYNMEGAPAADEAQGEQEMLLGHDWTYEVQDVEQTDDGLKVNMGVVSDA